METVEKKIIRAAQALSYEDENAVIERLVNDGEDIWSAFLIVKAAAILEKSYIQSTE